MSDQRPSALASAKAAAQMRAQEIAKPAVMSKSVLIACLLAQADAVRECARMVAPNSTEEMVYRMRQLAADLETAAKELE